MALRNARKLHLHRSVSFQPVMYGDFLLSSIISQNIMYTAVSAQALIFSEEALLLKTISINMGLFSIMFVTDLGVPPTPSGASLISQPSGQTKTTQVFPALNKCD